MQTFLPYPDFKQTAECLDVRRLGKQRVEAWQIYQCLIGKSSLRWQNHPAVRMWKEAETGLLMYGYIICDKWLKRGYKDNLREKFLDELGKTTSFDIKVENNKKVGVIFKNIRFPFWLGNMEFHASHRSNLLKKSKRDALWLLLIEQEKDKIDLAFVYTFPYQKVKMKEEDWLRLEEKFKDKKVNNHYRQFNWVEKDNLPYYWPI